MATKAQLTKIHIAKKELGLIDNDYRAILSSYDVLSAKDLPFADAEHLLGKFKELGWNAKIKYDKKKYAELHRGKLFATPKQLRAIEGMWSEIARSKTDESLRRFIERVTKRSHIIFLERKEASKVIIALRKMGNKGQ